MNKPRPRVLVASLALPPNALIPHCQANLGEQVMLDHAFDVRQPKMAALMQAYLGPTLSPHRQDFTALIGQAGESVNGIYEADYRDFNRETYARGRETFDATYAAFKKLLIGTWARDMKMGEER